MSANHSLLLVLVLLFCVYMRFGISVARAATGVPRILNYQGRLMDSTGNVLGGAGTNYCFQFSIYDSPVVGLGTKLWPAATPSTVTIPVKNGVFNAGIGDTSAGGDTLTYNFQDSDTVYLNVDVATKVGATCAPGDGVEVFESLSPRQRLVASAYAVNASTVGGYTPSQNASGNQVPVLASGNLILGGVDPVISATTTNALVIQGSGTGDVRFFNSSNRINATGNMTLGGSLFLASGSATSSLQSGITGTSTLQGFLNVLGTSSTSTFSGGLAVASFAVTGLATSTFASGINLSGGCFSVNGTCLSFNPAFSTTSANYYVDASSTIPKTYTANSFTATQTFINASTTNISAAYASSTQGYFGSVVVGTLSGFLKATAGVVTNSLVNLTSDISGILGVANGGTGWANLTANTLLTGNGSGAVATTTIGSSLQLSGGTLALNIGNPNVWTGLQTFGNASTSLASVFTNAYFGGTATTTIDSAGNVAVAGTLHVTGNTTLSNATTTNLLVTASSSILNLNGVNSTTTNATTTNFFASTARTGTLVSNGAVNFNTTLAVTGLTSLGSVSSTLLSVANGSATTTLQAQATSTFGAGVQTSSLSIGSLGGFLKAVSGFVTTSLVSLTSDVSGILGVANGGTGWASLAANTLLTGNGSGAVATTTIATSLQISGSSLGLNVANPNVWSGLQTFANASTTLLESMTQFAQTIESTSTNALVFKTNFTSSAGLTLGSTSTPQMLSLDTLNNRVTAGTGSGSANPTIFVTDTGNASDPAGVNGAMYYSSVFNAFRCFVNGSWQNCSGGGGSAASSTGDVQFKNIDGSFTATSNFNWNLASNGLTITGSPGQIGDLFSVASSTGAVMFSVSSAGVLKLSTTSDPSVPPSGQLDIYAKDIAGRTLPKWIGSSGVDTPFQANLGFNKIALTSSAGATMTAIGAVLTNSGTLSAAVLSTASLKQSVRRTTFATASTKNNLSDSFSNSLMVTRGNASGIGGFFYTVRFGLTAMGTGNRGFFGLDDVASAPTNVDPLTNTTPGKIGMAFNSNTGNWSFVINNSGTAPTVYDLGPNFTLNTTDLLELVLYAKPNDTVIGYRIKNLTTGVQISSTTPSVNIPSNTTFLGPTNWITNNATAGSVSFDLVGWYLESDN